MSPSVRRAWIEIVRLHHHCVDVRVALRTEGVDRNVSDEKTPSLLEVALRTEGVDRNFFSMRGFASNFGRLLYGGCG